MLILWSFEPAAIRVPLSTRLCEKSMVLMVSEWQFKMANGLSVFQLYTRILHACREENLVIKPTNQHAHTYRAGIRAGIQRVIKLLTSPPPHQQFPSSLSSSWTNTFTYFVRSMNGWMKGQSKLFLIVYFNKPWRIDILQTNCFDRLTDQMTERKLDIVL